MNKKTSTNFVEVFYLYTIVRIKDWNRGERPREKMMEQGVRSLSESELLAILINSGTRDMSAVELGRKILAFAGNSLTTLSTLSVDELCGINGIGQAKASKIAALFEIARRMEMLPEEKKRVIGNSESVACIFMPMLRDIQHEECWVLFLNRQNNIIRKEKISQGGIAGTVIDNRIILKKALQVLASSIILVHNHPSGNPSPSEADLKQTRLLREACRSVDISLLDHIIIGKQNYYSFADEDVGK